MSILHDSLTAWFEAEEKRQEAEHAVKHLHYGSDISPSACERAMWFRLHGGARRPLSLAERLMFAAGHRVEAMLLDAVAARGLLLARQGVVRPCRPSAWAWSGRFDGLMKAHTGNTREDADDGSLILVDVKTARSAAFKRKDGLLKESHVWQLSAYFHEIKRQRPALSHAELWYADRDGSNQPSIFALTVENGKLIPEAAIIAEEARKAPLALPDTPCPPLRPEMTREHYPCSYCPHLDVACRPDAERAAMGLPPVEREKKPRTPRKILSGPETPDPALSSAKAITDAASAAGAPTAVSLNAERQEIREEVRLAAEASAPTVKRRKLSPPKTRTPLLEEAPAEPVARSAASPAPEPPGETMERLEGLLDAGETLPW